MRRGFWFLAGAGAGIYAMVRGRRAAEVLTADGLADRLGALALGARLLREEVAQGQSDKEAELRARLGLAPGRPELAAAAPRTPEPAPALDVTLPPDQDERGST